MNAERLRIEAEKARRQLDLFRIQAASLGGSPLPPRQCDNWWGRLRCERRARYWLHAPDGHRVPGGPVCPECAEAIVTEYREKLGEEWTAEPLENIEQLVFG